MIDGLKYALSRFTSNKMVLLVFPHLNQILSSVTHEPQSHDHIVASSVVIMLLVFDADTTTLPIQLRHRLVPKTWNGVLSHAELENSSHIS
jgi:hypothetical protein